jgi:hypothetical protein
MGCCGSSAEKPPAVQGDGATTAATTAEQPQQQQQTQPVEPLANDGATEQRPAPPAAAPAPAPAPAAAPAQPAPVVVAAAPAAAPEGTNANGNDGSPSSSSSSPSTTSSPQTTSTSTTAVQNILASDFCKPDPVTGQVPALCRIMKQELSEKQQLQQQLDHEHNNSDKTKQQQSPPKNSDVGAGQKVLDFDDGSVYTGEVNAEGVPHGMGTYVYANGDEYQGPFVNGHEHGVRGVYRFLSEKKAAAAASAGASAAVAAAAKDDEPVATYEGGWATGQREGFGISINKSGKYVGFFHLDRKHGRGKWYYASGAVYDGFFEMDELHCDRGVYKFASGKVKIVRAADGKIVEQRKASEEEIAELEAAMGPIVPTFEVSEQLVHGASGAK